MGDRIDEAWREAHWALGVAAHDDARRGLRARYEEPHRRYHDLTHLDACLALFEEHRASAARVGELLLALLFHDAVYDPLAHDNEARSAELARAHLTAASAPSDSIERVCAMILDTRTHEPSSADAALLLDLDLSILGEDPATYDLFERAIRAEFQAVPDAHFVAGRSAVLERFLARPQIYHSVAFREEREAVARHNLTRAIAELRAGAQGGPESVGDRGARHTLAS